MFGVADAVGPNPTVAARMAAPTARTSERRGCMAAWSAVAPARRLVRWSRMVPQRATRSASAGREVLPIRPRRPVPAEAHRLVDPERTGQILGVDAERGLRHAALTKDLERSGDERGREPPPAPWPADTDVVEPAPGDAERLVLGRVDAGEDRAGDLVAVPRDLPEGGIDLRVREQGHEIRVVPLGGG